MLEKNIFKLKMKISYLIIIPNYKITASDSQYHATFAKNYMAKGRSKYVDNTEYDEILQTPSRTIHIPRFLNINIYSK